MERRSASRRLGSANPTRGKPWGNFRRVPTERRALAQPDFAGLRWRNSAEVFFSQLPLPKAFFAPKQMVFKARGTPIGDMSCNHGSLGNALEAPRQDVLKQGGPQEFTQPSHRRLPGRVPDTIPARGLRSSRPHDSYHMGQAQSGEGDRPVSPIPSAAACFMWRICHSHDCK